MNLTIDASSIVSGGGLTHLIELTNNIKSESVSIKVIASEKVLNELPNSIKKVSHPYLNKNIIKRIYFQIFILDRLLFDTDILFSITGDYLGGFRPLIGMSQNMLLFERENLRGFGFEKIKFLINYQRQRISFKKSDAIIFLSKHAQNIVESQIDLTSKQRKIINHGVHQKFHFENDFKNNERQNIVYVSSFHYYKNQINVIKAVNSLRVQYPNLTLTLIGDFINKSYENKIKDAVKKYNTNNWIKIFNKINYDRIQKFYDDADLIVFASSCENMPLILIESMASGKPIICSNKPPMTEFLSKKNYFFNPNEIDSIYNALLATIKLEENELVEISQSNKVDSIKYNWNSTAVETIKFVKHVHEVFKMKNYETN